jgi:hypothetical protein
VQTLILAPDWATKGLARFGLNPYGQPHFRVIWGPSRTYIAGGFFDRLGKSTYRRLVKYGLDPKWVLERWRPAAIYGSPQTWEANYSTPEGFLALGPFPAHGEYESCTVFSTGKGGSGYVPLEPGLVEMSARAVWMGKALTYSDIRRAHEDEELKREQEADAGFDDMWKEAQLSREGLTMGAGGSFNKQAQIDDYARKIERNNLFVNARTFRPGFRQS